MERMRIASSWRWTELRRLIMVCDRLWELFTVWELHNNSKHFSVSIDILWGFAFSETEEVVALRHFCGFEWDDERILRRD
jgi:hypothetical protein